MIDFTEKEYNVLSHSEKKQTKHFPVQRTVMDGFVAKKRCPVIEGNAYQARAMIRGKKGEMVERKFTVTAMLVIRLDGDGGWDVEFQGGDRSDKPRFLAKTGGDKDTPGYTSSVARAFEPDAPAVPEHIQRQWSQEAFERDKLNRQQRIDMAREGVAFLWGGGRDEKRAARLMQHELDKLVGEEKAA